MKIFPANGAGINIFYILIFLYLIFIFKTLCMFLSRNRFSPLICIIFLIITIASCKNNSSAPKQQPNPPVQVDVMIASLEKVDNTIEASGTIIANENVELHPE